MKHNWIIYDLKRTISNGVVTEVFYGCESHLKEFYTRHVGSFSLTGSTDDEGFIAYNLLESSDVLSWLDSNVNKSSIETSNSSSLASDEIKAANRISATGLPWE